MFYISGQRSISTIPNSPLFTTLFLRIWAGSRSLRAWMYNCVRVCVYPVCSLSIFVILWMAFDLLYLLLDDDIERHSIKMRTRILRQAFFQTN